MAYTVYTVYAYVNANITITLHEALTMINKVYKYKYCNVNRNSILYYNISIIGVLVLVLVSWTICPSV